MGHKMKYRELDSIAFGGTYYKWGGDIILNKFRSSPILISGEVGSVEWGYISSFEDISSIYFKQNRGKVIPLFEKGCYVMRILMREIKITARL